MYSAAFRLAFDETLGYEGGYSNDPDDAGGETKYGISKRSYPNVDIKNLNRDEAKAIYYKDFWMDLRLDEIRGDVAAEIFDTAVNMGRSTAIRFAQIACNYLGTRLVEDGQMGNYTITALQAKQHLASDLLKILNALQLSRYVTLVQENPSQQKFALGWLRRIQVTPT